MTFAMIGLRLHRMAPTSRRRVAWAPLRRPLVLVMSLWDDHFANMLWLDSTYPVDSTDPGALRGYCSTESGKPTDVESAQANSHVIFSDIKFGPIASTTDSSPTPSPTPGDCPGGSLSACIDLCPADAFAPCVES